MNIVIYGGQYGSEGKASAAEYWARNKETNYLTAIGENSPNSGHTCSKGITRNIPACSYFADQIILGPDSVIDYDILINDWKATGKPPIFIHENAARMNNKFKYKEQHVVTRISSTGSGSGFSRYNKFFNRTNYAIIKGSNFPKGIKILNTPQYINKLKLATNNSIILECSQGLLLDTNFGIYPYVTSRSTSPRVTVERNGLGNINWKYIGVYRTLPIRTGGPSGPTKGIELSWKKLGLKPEIATVTHRVRRIFSFSKYELDLSIYISRPDIIMITHMDYVPTNWIHLNYFKQLNLPIYTSESTGEFKKI